MIETLTKESPWSVAETITRLPALIDARGLKLLCSSGANQNRRSTEG